MGKVICRTQKYCKAEMKAVGNHHGRTKDAYISNPDIDASRTKNNLYHGDIQNLYSAVMKQINERCPMQNGKKRRKDAVLCYEILVSASPDWWPKDWKTMTQKDFLQTDGFKYLIESMDAIKEKIGVENYMGASLHLDEATPHLSIMFVPITSDSRLCAKDIITAQFLRDIQTLVGQIGAKYGLQRGVPREKGERKKHLDTEEYKALQDIKKALAKVQEKSAELASINKTLQMKVDELTAKLGTIANLSVQQIAKVGDFVKKMLDEERQAAAAAPDVAPR